MDSETEILQRYEAELAAIAALDRAYYLKAAPSVADRANYHQRKDLLEKVRARLYSELSALANLKQVRRQTEGRGEER